jgi:hypothetical protein
MPRFAARFATGFLEIVRYRAGRERTAQPMLLLYFNTVSDDATQEGVPDRLRRVFRAVRRSRARMQLPSPALRERVPEREA